MGKCVGSLSIIVRCEISSNGSRAASPFGPPEPACFHDGNRVASIGEHEFITN
jgi:hypothetical protein